MTFFSTSAFETAVERALGEEIRRQEPMCLTSIGRQLWGSLTNVKWRHENGDTVSYEFVAAADLIAAIYGEGTYVTWYRSSPDGVVSDTVRAALAREGWHPLYD
jgi:hypothetical protein